MYSHELYYIFFIILNLNINNSKIMGAPHVHCALTLKVNLCRVAVCVRLERQDGPLRLVKMGGDYPLVKGRVGVG